MARQPELTRLITLRLSALVSLVALVPLVALVYLPD